MGAHDKAHDEPETDDPETDGTTKDDELPQTRTQGQQGLTTAGPPSDPTHPTG